ncbi:tyrosine-type recombinase/integrase [Gracilibacillus sp. HCP3S3_G5_1]|uniref:site-specific integrase n=1 Tax=unclassified Gracilibacillus TaxID=2625209 RepID=UPI003F89E11D
MKLYKSKIDDEIYYYFLKNGEKRFMYRHKYHDALGKRKEKKKSGFKTEKETLKALLEVKSAILNGQVKQVEQDKMTVSQWLDIWYETYHVHWEESTCRQRRDVIKDIMKPLLGNYKLTKLDKTTYQRMYINKLLKTYAPSTVQLYHRLFKIAINAAVDDELLSHNRFNKITFEKETKLDNFLTAEELNILLDATKKTESITNYLNILLIAYTGLRKGESLGLKWKDVNFKNKTITVNCTRDHFGERPPKTKNSYRTIPIDDFIIDHLKSYQKWCMQAKLKKGESLDKENDHVFLSPYGTPISNMVINQVFDRVYKHLEDEGIKLKRITPHGLRHTHATILINKGIPDKIIADRLGDTTDLVNRVYVHSLKEMEDKAVSLFSETLSGAKIGAN